MNLPISDNLELRLRQSSDAEAVFQLIIKNKDEFRKWLPWVDGVKDVKDTKEYIESNVGAFNNKTGVDLGIWYEEKWIGSVGTNKIDAYNKKAEIGYWLDEEYNNKGIMTQSVKALVEYLFKELDIHRIQISVDPENVKSWAIPEKLGFTFEGTLREDQFINNKFQNSKIYSLLKSDYQEKQI